MAYGSPHAKLNQRLGGSEVQVHQQFGFDRTPFLTIKSGAYLLFHSPTLYYVLTRLDTGIVEAARGVFEAPQEIFDFLLEKKVMPSTLPRMITFIPFTSMDEVVHT